MSAEILRLLGNVCQIGTITQTKSAEGLALAKVKIDDRETDFFPVVSKSNSFKKHYIPVRVDEQVAVFCPFGEANIGFIIPGLFNKSCKEPTGSSDVRETITYEDGTSIFYDTEAKELNINAVGKINVTCKSATVTADTVDITATTTNTGNVTINGTLTVSKQITGAGGMAISGGSGASFDGNINSTGSISVDGSISDSKGSLTNHSNNGYGRD